MNTDRESTPSSSEVGEESSEYPEYGNYDLSEEESYSGYNKENQVWLHEYCIYTTSPTKDETSETTVRDAH